MDYPTDSLSSAERQLLAPYVSSLDAPVFALLNLPETVKAALLSRYSRYQGTLRRLLLDEFAEVLSDLPVTDGYAGQRAESFMETLIGQYGDDSVMQLGGAHVACEWSSNVLTKILQRPRIGAYLEQSTRYIAFDQPMDEAGRFRYYRHPELGPEYERDMDRLFGMYGSILEHMTAWARGQFPRAEGESEAAWARATRAKALDACRGLLPAASLSHMGIYASGQTYEQLVLHLLAHPLPEARECGERMLSALQATIPTFLGRVRRPERGGVWIDYLQQRREAGERWGKRLRTDEASRGATRPSVTLLDHHGDQRRLLAALLFEHTGLSESAALEALAGMSGQERSQALLDLAGERINRRHRPGRGLEALGYRFEVVSDYGAFRDLQRHRMLTMQWQPLTPQLGAEIPQDIADAGALDGFQQALEISRTAHDRLAERGLTDAAPYALCLAYRIRYILDLNAREAMHLCELRSGAEGHPAYRAVALELHRQISEVHPVVGAMMRHMDHSADARLERLQAELRLEAKRQL